LSQDRIAFRQEKGLSLASKRYINDQKICTPMAARCACAGLDMKADTNPRAQLFPWVKMP
jgi:hypothetical protein